MVALDIKILEEVDNHVLNARQKEWCTANNSVAYTEQFR